MKKIFYSFFIFIFSILFISISQAETTKKYCWDWELKKNIYDFEYCDWDIWATREKVAEYSDSNTCGWYYKTFIYKTNNKLTGIFISNWNCQWWNQTFRHMPTWWITEECKRRWWTWNYKWIYRKEVNYAWSTTWVVCEIEFSNNDNNSWNINLDECPSIEAKVCWKKWYYYSVTRKTYKNMCYLMKDGATYVSAWECQLRDNKWCLVDKYKWCANLKRCLKNTKTCPSSVYTPNIDEATKNVLNPLITDFINKIENKFSNWEDRLKIIDKVGEKIDKMIYRHSKYKDILYYMLQAIEAKRVAYLNLH
jgi:hypothetical protein